MSGTAIKQKQMANTAWQRPTIFLHRLPTERWQSGWMHRSWKPARVRALRGFESHPLRHKLSSKSKTKCDARFGIWIGGVKRFWPLPPHPFCVIFYGNRLRNWPRYRTMIVFTCVLTCVLHHWWCDLLASGWRSIHFRVWIILSSGRWCVFHLHRSER